MKDPAIVLAEAETQERELADRLLAVSSELLRVQQLPWDHMIFDSSAYALLSRLSDEKRAAFDDWKSAHETTTAARIEWLKHI